MTTLTTRPATRPLNPTPPYTAELSATLVTRGAHTNEWLAATLILRIPNERGLTRLMLKYTNRQGGPDARISTGVTEHAARPWRAAQTSQGRRKTKYRSWNGTTVTHLQWPITQPLGGETHEAETLAALSGALLAHLISDRQLRHPHRRGSWLQPPPLSTFTTHPWVQAARAGQVHPDWATEYDITAPQNWQEGLIVQVENRNVLQLVQIRAANGHAIGGLVPLAAHLLRGHRSGQEIDPDHWIKPLLGRAMTRTLTAGLRLPASALRVPGAAAPSPSPTPGAP